MKYFTIRFHGLYGVAADSEKEAIAQLYDFGGKYALPIIVLEVKEKEPGLISTVIEVKPEDFFK